MWLNWVLDVYMSPSKWPRWARRVLVAGFPITIPFWIGSSLVFVMVLGVLALLAQTIETAVNLWARD